MCSASTRLSRWLIPLSLAALAWCAVPLGTFQFDDFPNILLDPATSDPAALFARLGSGFRPLLRLSFALDHAVFGERAAGWLLHNLLLHLGCCAAVGWLAWQRFGAAAAPWAAALFALQPAQAEAVAYVTGRSTLQVTLLLLLALIAHNGPRRWLAGLFFLAGCATKEVALVFPLLVLIWEVTAPAVHRPIGRTAPYLLATVGALGLLLLSPRLRELLAFSSALHSPLATLAINAEAVPALLSLWARPWALTIEHLQPDGAGLEVWLGSGAILILASSGWLARRRAPLLALALLWALGALVPTNSVIAKLDPIIERSLYLAWVGPALALGAGLEQLSQKRSSPLGRGLCAVGALVAIGLCQWRVGVWRHPERLWYEATRSNPTSSRAWNNLGRALAAQGNGREAEQALREALQLDPRNAEARRNLDLLPLLMIGAREREEGD